MGKTFDEGKDEIVNLCRYFAINHEAFLAQGVKEADIRQSLIDPLFEALGWDVRNTAQVAPQYREVIPEKSLEVEGQQKSPDYTFRVGTLPKFYVEAKKCGAKIGGDPLPAFQLRRYGWSAKVAVSILTDFEGLAVYDCALRPRPADKASHARILYFRFEDYPDRWRELWDIFSREAVWSGAFDQYAASKRKRGTSEVDAEFLKEIESWRDALARNIALRNKDLSSDDLNVAVQTTIDRVVFLRMAEDRGLEPYEQLLKLCDRAEIYPRFMRDLCRRADEKYNSGLFHFQKESGISEDPDRITTKLTIDDKVFKPILQSLYFAHGSPYHFGVLPVEILGTVYERFLGKVIRLTAGHQAKVEEKPEVRKAGGVYYTPAYIVDYIVEQTVGQKIQGKSPAELAGGKNRPPFRVLDMACGSGSFLLGGFSKLRNHILANHRVRDLCVFAFPVFKNAAIENSIEIVEKAAGPAKFPVTLFATPKDHARINTLDPAECIQRGIIDPRRSREAGLILAKMDQRSVLLGTLVRMNRGIHAYRTDGYGKSKYGPGPQTERDKAERVYHAQRPLDKTYLPELCGKDVFRFRHSPPREYLSYGDWLAEPRTPEFFYKPKAVVRKILGVKLSGTFLPDPVAVDQSLYVIISKTDDVSTLKTALGILLSRVGAWYLRTKHAIHDVLYPWYTKGQLAAYPIPKPAAPAQDRVIELVDDMLSLSDRLAEAKSEAQKAILQRQMDSTDAEIDRIVYELYGLTAAEIAIVEGTTK